MKLNEIQENLRIQAAEGSALRIISSLLDEELKKKLHAVSCNYMEGIGKEDSYKRVPVEAEFDIVFNDKTESAGITIQGYWCEEDDMFLFLDKREAMEDGLNAPYFHYYAVYVQKKNGPEIKRTIFTDSNEAGSYFFRECQILWKDIQDKKISDEEEYEIVWSKYNSSGEKMGGDILKSEYKDGQINPVMLL